MVIVDVSVIKYSLLYSRHLSDEFKTNPELIKHYFLQSILSIKQKFSCNKFNKLVLAIDKKKSWNNDIYGYWRDVIYNQSLHILPDTSKSYKDGRKPQEGYDWEVINKSMKDCLNVMQNYSDFIVIEVPGVEADDIIAILSQKVKETNTIITVDKDMKQLISDNILFYDWRTKDYHKERLTEDDKQLFFLKGDGGDGIKSVKPRYQWKRNLAKKSLQDIFDEFPDLPLEKRFKLNKLMMDLSIESLPDKVIKLVMDEYTNKQGSYNQLKIMSELNDLGLDSMIIGDIRSIAKRSEEFKLSRYSTQSKTTKKYKKDLAKENEIRNRFLN